VRIKLMEAGRVIEKPIEALGSLKVKIVFPVMKRLEVVVVEDLLGSAWPSDVEWESETYEFADIVDDFDGTFYFRRVSTDRLRPANGRSIV